MSDLQGNNLQARAVVAAVSELLFALLPFAVVFIVFAYQQRAWYEYIMAPEWAFASALLFGQSIVKIVQGTLNLGKGINVPAVMLTISLLIIVGLVPSMVLLAIVLTGKDAPLWMGITQVILAIVAGVFFVIFAAIAHEYSTSTSTST
jgi:hypothetical protein